MNILDISWPIMPTMTAYKNRSIVSFVERKDINRDGVCETTITLDAHSGTHIDAPAHFIASGDTVEHISLHTLIGAARVIDCTSIQEAISVQFLQEQIISENDIILFKTINSFKHTDDTFSPEFVFVDASAAQYLAQKKVKAVGIDYLGIERMQLDHRTHITLMESRITIIEGLRLGHVRAGTYQMYCLPLNVVGIEAAPARAILIEE